MSPSALAVRAQSELAARAVPADAGPMAAYMKTDQPFYGVRKPARAEVLKVLAEEHPPVDRAAYRVNVEELWALPHREENYLAIAYARAFPDHVTFDQIDLYERLVSEGAWWDLVDETAVHLVGPVALAERRRMRPLLECWVDGDDMWLRRTAIICGLRHGSETDERMLFDFCLRRAHESEFFIRKAIGWALREYSRTDPRAVAGFLDDHGDRLSGLSRREASRRLRT